MKRAVRVASVVAALLVACGDEETQPVPKPIPLEAGACGHGLYVVSSDYASTSVSVLGFEGNTVAADWIDSGAASPGLSAALSGDVVVPTVQGNRVVWIDRAASAITWIDAATGRVEQLGVGTGFGANPYDALTVAPGKAYVARYQRNVAPGREPFDQGSDLLVVDEQGPSIVGRVDLAAAVTEPMVEPRPTRLVRRGDDVLVLLGLLSPDYAFAGEGRLAVVDPTTDAVTRVVSLTGARNCNGLAVSPSGRYVGVACSGTIVRHDDGTLVPAVDESFVIVLDADAGLTEVTRLPAVQVGRSFTFSLAFVSEGHVLVPTFGSKEPPAADDELIDLDVAAATTTVVHRSPALSLGDVRCVCDRCYVADATSDRLIRVVADAGGAAVLDGRSEVVTSLGLPPRGIGAF